MPVLVFNFGGQYAHLIARRVRELGVYSEIVSSSTTAQEAKKLSATGIILSGGPCSVYEENAPRFDANIISLGIPILGICYGHQLLAYSLGGVVESGKSKEFGKQEIVLGESALFEGVSTPQTAWFSHGDEVKKLPRGFKEIAFSPTCGNAAMQCEEKKLFGIQFHPEVVHTPCGKKVLENFLFKICGCEATWRVGEQAEKFVEELKAQVGREKVVIGISGGVDSLVAATLLHKAVGKQLYCVLIDHGLMRKNEVSLVTDRLKKQGFENLVVEDARETFLSALAGVADPEEKRKAIGHTFIAVFEKVAATLEAKEGIRFLAQGTIYPDRIESASSSNAAKIKSHHNLALPEKMKFQIIEPLKEFYKDEVRELGGKLGLPQDLLQRHPFPGPGLAIRVLGEVTEERLHILREADAIYLDELKKSGWYNKVWQAFAALLPVKSVGVMGDARTYDYIIALRAVDSVDGMTADWSKLPPELIEKVSSRIVNEVRGVNRVLYDVTQKPPGTIEYE